MQGFHIFRKEKNVFVRLGLLPQHFLRKEGGILQHRHKNVINAVKLAVVDREEVALNSFWRKLCVKCAKCDDFAL